MQLHMIGKNIEVTDALKAYTTEKLKSLEKRFHSINKINITFIVEHITHIVEATVTMDGIEIHASAKENDMYETIDSVVAKLQTQLTKHKEKIIDDHR